MDFSKYSESDLSFMFASKDNLEKPTQNELIPKNESPYLELSDPNKHPIFDISYNKVEKKLFISGIDFLKSFKVFDFNY